MVANDRLQRFKHATEKWVHSLLFYSDQKTINVDFFIEIFLTVAQMRKVLF
jgi:hypothetical protein